MSEAALFRLPDLERIAAARQFEGQLVAVQYDIHRDGSVVETKSGLVLAVATPYGPGAQTAAVVLRDEHGRARLLSLALVRSIRLLGVAEADAWTS